MYLIIARAAENRIWPWDFAGPGLNLGRCTECVRGVLATLPGAQGPQGSPLSPLFGHLGPAPYRLCQPCHCHGLYSARQLLAKEKMGRANPFSPWSDSCDPYEECALVWRRRPCWVGCCVPKPGLVALYTYYIWAQMCRLRLMHEYIQTRISSVVKCILPCLYSFKHHFMCMQNFVRWDWSQGGTWCTKKALCACSPANVCVLKSDYAGSRNRLMPQSLSQDLIAFTVQPAGLGKY